MERAAFSTGSRRLSPLDAAFLYFERPNQRLQVGCLAELEGPIGFRALVETVADRLCRIPRYRQRPVRAAFDLDRPTWEADPDFDLERHVHHVALPAPGGPRELHALVDQLFSAPLDADRPLWELHLIDGLADGRSAILFKMHHCMIDGVSGAQLLGVLTDAAGNDSAEPARDRAATPMDHDARDRPASTSGAHERGSLGALLSTAGAIPGAAIRFGRDLTQALSTIGSLVAEPNTPLPFNGPLSGRRHVVWADLALDEVMSVRAAAGCKVNDVVLAIVAGALHRYLEARGFGTQSARVRVLVPVSVRGDGDRLSLGNLVTAMLPKLPIGPMDASERLRRIVTETTRLKEGGQARATGALLALAGTLPTPVEAAIGRFSPDWPVVSTVCTNVPGPPDERSIVGRRITAVHPIVPLAQGMGLEFAAMSYAGRISIAAVADDRLVPEPLCVRDALAQSAAELFAMHRARSESRHGETRSPSVRDLMTREVATVQPGDTLLAAYRLMRQRSIRHLPVVDPAERVLGIVTHRDVLSAQPSSLVMEMAEARARSLSRREVAEVMERHVSVALEDEPAGEAGLRMARQKLGCLPVVTPDRRLVGIVTTHDFLRWAVDAMQPATAIAAID